MPWSIDLLGKLIIAQTVKKFTTFMEPEGSLPCSQQPTNEPYPEPDASSPHFYLLHGAGYSLKS
jgi:hypothetical protein